MTSTQDFLVEIGTEELPPKALARLSNSFGENLEKLLDDACLGFSRVKTFATPRRLAVMVEALEDQQQDKIVERRGPAVSAAYDKNGKPTKAVIGFAKSCGVSVEELQQIETPKGSWVSFKLMQKGQKATELIPDIVSSALDRLPIPRRMRWSDLPVEFVRPVHWIVLLMGKQTVPATIYGITSGRSSQGHRFHANHSIDIEDVAEYESRLEIAGKVIADFDKRQKLIEKQIYQTAKKAGGNAVVDPDLLAEVTSMVEWPMAISGDFDPKFLDVPAEALVSAMKHHQKYFHLVDADGQLLPSFITISNIESTHPESVKAGNEKVIRPRLSDSMFFWQQDKKTPLVDRLNLLRNVVFQKKLGTLYDKTMRTRALATSISKTLGLNEKEAARAAELCKCDLMTEMVGEFPDLQGTMGRYYAQHFGEPETVALAIEQYYQPRFSGDEIPDTPLARCLALADKLDTIVGIFGIGLAPTGDKDPFALRRAVLGCVRILIEADLDLDLKKLLNSSFQLYEKQATGLLSATTVQEVYDFMLGRLPVYYTSRGIEHDSVESVICLNPDHLNDAHKRILAVDQFRTLPEASSLADANKRISNIIKKADNFKQVKINKKLLAEGAESALARAVEKTGVRLEPLFAKSNYTEAMSELAGLRDTVDEFFDNVMVMDDNMKIRNNRLALLSSLRAQFLRIADISRLQS